MIDREHRIMFAILALTLVVMVLSADLMLELKSVFLCK